MPRVYKGTSGFDRPDHFRVAFCVDDQTIVNAIPGFRRAIESFQVDTRGGGEVLSPWQAREKGLNLKMGTPDFIKTTRRNIENR